MGVVPPRPASTTCSALCAEYGALLIMDEVLTGFRVTRSGWYGREGVPGDLMTFGKVMGGGLPAAAFGGRADIMERLAPSGPVYQAGTLLVTRWRRLPAGRTLRECSAEVYRQIDGAAAAVAKLTADALTEAGVPFRLQQAGSLFSFFLGLTEPVRDFGAARGQSAAAYAAFFHAMLDGGVYLPPGHHDVLHAETAHQHSAGIGGDGHSDGVAAGHWHRAAGWHRDHSPKHVFGPAG